MQRQSFRTFLSATFIGTALLALPACPSSSGAVPVGISSPLSDKKLPSIERRTMDGTKVNTDALKGKVVIVKFFAKYCEPCKKTLPAVQKMHQEIGSEVAFIGIDVDESNSDAQWVIDTFKLTFPVIFDQGNVISGKFRVTEMPTTFVADKTGTVRWVGGPTQSEEDLQNAINSLR